jgi:hypothetical protein
MSRLTLKKRKYCQTWGSAETWTRIIGFGIRNAKHYKTESSVLDIHSFISDLSLSGLTFEGFWGAIVEQKYL